VAKFLIYAVCWFIACGPAVAMAAAPETIELSKEDLSPKGKNLNLGNFSSTAAGWWVKKCLGKFTGIAGLVYTLEQNRSEIAYAIDEMNDAGVPITYENIQEWIAEDHNIDTSGGVEFDYDNPPGEGDTAVLGDIAYVLGSHFNYIVLSVANYPPPVAKVNGIIYIFDKYKSDNNYYYAHGYYIASQGPASSAFDPDNYPDVFGDDVIENNAVEAILGHCPDFTLTLDRYTDPFDDDFFQTIPVDYLVDSDGDGVVDAGGNANQVQPLPDDMLQAFLLDGLPVIESDSVGSNIMQADDGTELITTAGDAAIFQAAGVPPTATITTLDPDTGVAKYVNPDGSTGAVTLSQSQINALTPAVTASLPSGTSQNLVFPAASAGSSSSGSGYDFDPGDDSFDVPIFDSTFTPLEEKEEIPWSDWLSYVPFMNLIEGSSLNVSGADPIIDVHFDNFAGLGAKSIQYDFSEWDSVFNAMGGLIYSFACFAALRMALVKKG
jgi:hypothetical protein